MGRQYTTDTTNVFRQKVTRKGHRPPSIWVQGDKGEDYETVSFYGPYLTRNVGGNPWVNANDHTVTIEVQKLGATENNLVWLTERTLVIDNTKED